MGKCCSKRQEPQPIGKTASDYFVFMPGYKKAEAGGLNSKHSNGGSLDRYTADPNQRGAQARADIIRPRPTPCKQLQLMPQQQQQQQQPLQQQPAQQPQPTPPITSLINAASHNLNNHHHHHHNHHQHHHHHHYSNHHQARKASCSTRSENVAAASHTQRANKIVVALYNYTARESTDVSFMKGDRMEVLDDSEPDWWKVLHLTTLQEGLIPWNFVAVERSVESEDWFFENVSRKEAGKLLLVDENPRGTFLVRPSEHNPRGYSLSVKDWEEGRGHHVKHYKIKPLDNGGFFIATNQTFPTLQALVMAYSKNALGLCHVLSKPCPKPQPDMWDLGPELRDKWEINRSEIQLIRKLGYGHFGEVYYGKWRNKIEVAVKTLRPGTMSKEAFLQEAAIMKQFRHRHLVALYAVCSKEEPIYIVQEYMCNGSLLDFLRTGDGKYMQFEDLIYIAAQVASGMEHLESKQLIHRDLAARNVLIGEKNKAKICDFGLARIIEDDEYCPKQGSRFPVKWTAPEAIVYARFSIKSDVWSYGILLMELFTYGQVPYPGMHGREVIEQVNNGYRMPKPVNHPLPDSIYRLMLQCWDAVPEKRPTFEFLNHYFESFNVTSEIPYLEPPTD